MATITQPLTGVPIIQHRGHAEIERDEECGYVDKKDGYGEGEIGRGMITSMSMNSDGHNELVRPVFIGGGGCAQPINPFLDVRLLPVNWAYLHCFPLNTRKWNIQSH